MRRFRGFLLVLTAVALTAALLPAPASAVETLRVTDVSFTDANHGFIVGGRSFGGFASYTADGGTTWHPTTFSQWIQNASVVDASTASIIGSFANVAYSTSDSGSTWLPTTGAMVPGVGALNMSDIARLPGNVLVAVGQHMGAPEGDLATIWRSANGGGTWSKRLDGPVQPRPDPETEPPSTIAGLVAAGFAVDGQVGWSVGTEWTPTEGSPNRVFKQVLVYKTSSGGSDWTTQTVPGATQPATSLKVVNASTAWIGCANGAVYVTTNGGASWVGPRWAPFGSLQASARFAIDALDGQTAVVVGDYGRVSLTNDGGVTWLGAAPGNTYFQPTLSNLDTVDMVDSNVWYVGGSDVLLKTTDGGAHWSPVSFTVPSDKTETYLSVRFAETTASSYGIPYGTSPYLTVQGVLVQAGTSVRVTGQTVDLWTSFDGSNYTKSTSKVSEVSPGVYSIRVLCTRRTWYRLRFGGTPQYGSSLGRTLNAGPKAWMTAPVAPSTFSRSRTYGVSGYLKPRHSGSPVKIYAYQKIGGAWTLRATFSAQASNYSTYSRYVGSIRLPSAGAWRIRAYHRDNAGGVHYASYSSWRYITVK